MLALSPSGALVNMYFLPSFSCLSKFSTGVTHYFLICGSDVISSYHRTLQHHCHWYDINLDELEDFFKKEFNRMRSTPIRRGQNWQEIIRGNHSYWRQTRLHLHTLCFSFHVSTLPDRVEPRVLHTSRKSHDVFPTSWKRRVHSSKIA